MYPKFGYGLRLASVSVFRVAPYLRVGEFFCRTNGSKFLSEVRMIFKRSTVSYRPNRSCLEWVSKFQLESLWGWNRSTCDHCAYG